MPDGYMGKLFFIDFSEGKIREEAPDEALCRNYIGGYGIGSRIIYSRQKAGVDPLGPDNMLGFLTGPFTGTPCPCRLKIQRCWKITINWHMGRFQFRRLLWPPHEIRRMRWNILFRHIRKTCVSVY